MSKYLMPCMFTSFINDLIVKGPANQLPPFLMQLCTDALLFSTSCPVFRVMDF